MKGSMAVARILKLEGVKFVSGFPGAGAAAGLINATAELGITSILARQERVAVNIADGYTRVSGRTGVAIVSHGVGVENAFSGVSQAFSDLVPILVLGGQVSRHLLGARTVQDFDALFSYHNITKWVERINFADRVPELMRRAFTYLRTGRPSPVFLEMPSDVADEEFDDARFSYRPVKGWKMGADPHDVHVAVRALLAAKNPIIYAGEGVYYAGAWDELRELVELVQAPVMTTLKGKGVFPEDHPLSVGNGGRMTGTKVAAHFLQKADLVFTIGASLTRGYGAPLRGKVLVQSTIDESDINKDYDVDYVIVGDAKLVLKQLIDEIRAHGPRRRNEALTDEIKAIKAEWLNEWMPKLTSNEVPINPYRVIWDLAHAVDRKNVILTAEAGCPRDHFAPMYETITPRGYLGWGHHSTLGYSLGAAIGAKLAEPEKTVINVMGDAAFGMVGVDFETAVRSKIPILTIVLNNSGMGTYFDWTPPMSVLSGNYSKVAEALGGYSERVEKPDEIIPSIKRAKKSLDSGQAALLEIITKVELSFQSRYWSDLYKA